MDVHRGPYPGVDFDFLMGRLCTLMSVFVLLLLFSFNIARSQTLLTPGGHSTAQGQLTVTATVVCSASLVWDEKSTPHIVLANCPDPADNVSQLTMIVLTDAQKRRYKGKADDFQKVSYTSRMNRIRADVLFSSDRSAQQGSPAHRSVSPHFTRRTQ